MITRNISLPLLLIIIAWSPLRSQNIYKSKGSTISFFAGTAVEDISAITTKSVSFLNTGSGEVIVSIPMTSFQFEQSLMQDHFNENYVESEKYPKAEFKGKIKDHSGIDWNSLASKPITVEGVLTIHGVQKPRTLEVRISKQQDVLEATSTFSVPLADHNIERPKILWEKLADEVEVKIKITYELYKPPVGH